mmetsp:Transcript_3572/g.9133  ORF Transcript_3572/g.9133 Transcript_3572/m.9133 type:complete len:288 (+) Transcript_3572:113-976(+)
MAQIGKGLHSRQQQKKNEGQRQGGGGGKEKRDSNQQFRQRRIAKASAENLDRFAGSSEDEEDEPKNSNKARKKSKRNREGRANNEVDGGDGDNSVGSHNDGKNSNDGKQKAVQPVIEGKRFAKRQRKELAKQKGKERIAKMNQEIKPTTDDASAGDTKTTKKDPRKKKSKPSPASGWQLKGGVIAKDITVGDGKPVKFGYKASITYVGSFPTNGNKVFDNGKLTFIIGTGKVVEGMEVGVAGMKVGGERVITIPPNMGYGEEGSPPDIPGGATLEFRVQLLSFRKDL